MHKIYKNGVSIILNTLNDEFDLKRMLESLQNSEYNELIIVDGGSTDSTIEIAKQYTNNVYLSEKGILRQQSKALKLVNYKNLVIVEADNIYPKNFIQDIIIEYKENDYFGLHATIKCIRGKTFFEKGLSIFYSIHHLEKGEKGMLGGVAIWDTKKYIEIFNETKKVQGYSSDTTRSEILKLKNLKVGLGYTFAYQYEELKYKTFLKKYFNYGKGDYDFYNSHKKDWTLKRKLKSIFHIFNRYIIDYPIKSLKVDKPYIAIPYLWLSAIVRYSGWVYSIFKNLNVAK